MRESRSALRLYSFVTCIVLAVVALVFMVLAITSDPAHRGAFIALGIIWAAMAGGAIGLMVALERRRRASGQDVPTGRPDRPEG